MDFSTLGGNLLGTVLLRYCIVLNFPLNLFLFAVMLGVYLIDSCK